MSTGITAGGPSPSDERGYCPSCGAVIHTAEAKKCWLCQRELAPGDTTSEQALRFRAQLERIRQPEAQGAVTPAAGTLLLVVCLGAGLVAPGLLFVLLILATPAMIRVARAKRRARTTGEVVVGTFLSALGTIILIGLASVAAFWATCFAVCMGGLALNSVNRSGSYEWILFPSVGAGLVLGVLVAVRLYRRLWVRRR